MPRTRDFEDDDSNPFDRFGILKDGRSYRVPLQLRDALPDDKPLTADQMMARYIRQDTERRRHLHVSDGVDAPFSMQRPGFRRLVGGNRGQQNIIDRQREKVLDARRAYVDDLQSAWQSPPTGAGSHGHEYSGGQVGDVCSINGRPGRLVEGDDGSLVCTANADNAANINELDHMSLPQLQAHRRRVTDVAYKEYESWISNQWHSK